MIFRRDGKGNMRKGWGGQRRKGEVGRDGGNDWENIDIFRREG